MARPEQHAARVGLACHDAVPPHQAAEHVFVAQAVLKRKHDGVWADQAQRRPHGFLCVEGLDEHDQQVHRAGFVLNLPGVGGRGYRNDAVYTVHTHAQAEPAHFLHVFGSPVDQPYRQTRLGERAADRAAERSGAKNGRLQGTSSPVRLWMGVGSRRWCPVLDLGSPHDDGLHSIDQLSFSKYDDRNVVHKRSVM